MEVLFLGGSMSNLKASLKLRVKTMCIVGTISSGKAGSFSSPLHHATH